MSAVAGGWSLGGITRPPNSSTFFLRARGLYSTGLGNGSRNAVEQTLQIDNIDVFRDGFE
jgi:hypothetical protein